MVVKPQYNPVATSGMPHSVLSLCLLLPTALLDYISKKIIFNTEVLWCLILHLFSHVPKKDFSLLSIIGLQELIIIKHTVKIFRSMLMPQKSLQLCTI